MVILYCEACGTRVSEGDLTSGSAGRKGEFVYCSSCAPAHIPKKQLGSGIHSIPRKKASGIHVSPVQRTVPGVQAAQVLPRRSLQQNGMGGFVIGAVGIVLISISLLILNATKSTSSSASMPAEPKITPPKVNERPALSTPENSKNIATAPVQSQQSKVDEIRENYVRRQWVDLKFEAERAPNGWTTGKRVKDFATTYANTAAGKEAAEFLKAKKYEVPPPPGTLIHALYTRDFKGPEPTQGWRYLWNKDGNIGNSSKYALLPWNASQGAYAGDPMVYPAPAPLSCAQLSNALGHPGGGTDSGGGMDRFVIAAYTLQPGQGGKTAISLAMNYKRQDVNGGRIELRVYVNDNLHGSMLIASSPTEYQILSQLGDLKAGDTVYVCVGPDREDGSDSFKYDFTIYPIP
jgi:hypothetical protein